MPSPPLVHQFDVSESRYRAVQPFARLFALYAQLAATFLLIFPIALIVVAAFFAGSNDTAASLLGGFVTIEGYGILVAAGAIVLGLVIGQLNAVSAIALAAVLAVH